MGARSDTTARLVHVMVIGGTPADWARLDDDEWDRLIGDLGAAVAAAGARWLTLRPYRSCNEGSTGTATEADVATARARDGVVETASCTVVVDSAGDGRARFAAAMNELDPARPVDEGTVAAALYAPAEAEPDLVVIVGPDDRLPPSLVWELAYAELVFLDIEWSRLGPDHVDGAIREFAGRQRRFGGLGS